MIQTNKKLRPVPPSLDTTRLQAAVGLQEKMVRNTLEGELVFLLNFVDDIDNEEENLEIVSDSGQFKVKQKCSKRKINSYITWLQAWHNYERLMVEFHGFEAHDRMADYKITILDFSKKYHWEAVERLIGNIVKNCQENQKTSQL